MSAKSHSEAPRTVPMRVPRSRTDRLELETVHLKVVSGPDAGLKASLCLPTLRIGTSPDNDLVLTDRSVSRYQAELALRAEGLVIRDVGSTNGTFVGGLRITEAFVGHDSECTLGHSRLVIQHRTETPKLRPCEDERLGSMVGRSAPMRRLFSVIRAIAATPTTILLRGESGVGKELAARTLHELSARTGPFVVFDASVADREMVRNDLFGHIKGAFTGANASRQGAFRHAHHGTLFIDEIGELPLDLQPRLLRALESREVTPIGADKPVRVDVRVIAATHRNLEAMVSEGTFRQDLFYRLSVIPIWLPALREIKEDIPLLAGQILANVATDRRLTEKARQALQHYCWPGNIRELRNVLERAAALRPAGDICARDLGLDENLKRSSDATPSKGAMRPWQRTPSPLRDREREHILEALRANDNNKAATARQLGISLSTLKRRLKTYRGQ